jgi:hypothetical protein
MNTLESPNRPDDFHDRTPTPAARSTRVWRNAHLQAQLLAYMLLLIWLLGPGF